MNFRKSQIRLRPIRQSIPIRMRIHPKAKVLKRILPDPSISPLNGSFMTYGLSSSGVGDQTYTTYCPSLSGVPEEGNLTRQFNWIGQGTAIQLIARYSIKYDYFRPYFTMFEWSEVLLG